MQSSDSNSTFVETFDSNSVSSELIKEKKRLEKMVGELFEQGGHNMGEDLRILKQSMLLDKLIVNEMMLREMEDKYSK